MTRARRPTMTIAPSTLSAKPSTLSLGLPSEMPVPGWVLRLVSRGVESTVHRHGSAELRTIDAGDVALVTARIADVTVLDFDSMRDATREMYKSIILELRTL